MDMDQISAFVAISRLKSFSRAADALHRSQPAISRRIDLLNQELGAPLFERVKGGIALSDAGTTLLPYAEAALAAASDGVAAVRALLLVEIQCRVKSTTGTSRSVASVISNSSAGLKPNIVAKRAVGKTCWAVLNCVVMSL